MATTAKTATATATKGKAADAPFVPQYNAKGELMAQLAPVAPAAPAAVVAPQAPLFVMGGWPVKSQTGNSVRAYCYAVAKALAKAQPEGFTVAQYASALAGAAQGSTMRQPSTGWGSVAKPNGTALQHANWFAHAKQGWLAPAPAPKG